MTIQRERPADGKQMYFSDLPRIDPAPVLVKYAHRSIQREDEVNVVVEFEGRTRNLRVDGEEYERFFLGLGRDMLVHMRSVGSKAQPKLHVWYQGERIDPSARDATTPETIRRRQWGAGGLPPVPMDEVAAAYGQAFRCALALRQGLEADGIPSAERFDPNAAAAAILAGTLAANARSRPNDPPDVAGESGWETRLAPRRRRLTDREESVRGKTANQPPS